jgi:type IV pilus assembly protein PilM
MNWGWKRTFTFEHKEVLGLDIGSSEVKLIELRKNGSDYTVVAAGIVDIAAGEDNSTRRETKTVSAIRECLQSVGTRTRMAVCGVSGPEVAVRYFKFPSLPPEEIEGAVLLEAAQVCPFNIDAAAVDYQLMPDGDDSACGVLVAATNELIQRKRQLAKGASLQCVLMDIDGLALLNCFDGLAGEYGKNEAGRATAILNVGSSYTTLVIRGDNGLPFIRDIACGANDIAERIATENGVSVERARRILSDCEGPGEAEPELSGGLAKACQKLIVDITETLRYYAVQEKDTVVERIFGCGGLALVKGFVELLDNRLPTRTVSWNPFDKIRNEGGQRCEDILAKKGPVMAVAAGLAMRSV